MARDYKEKFENMRWIADDSASLSPGVRVKIDVRNEFEQVFLIPLFESISVRYIGEISTARKTGGDLKKEILQKLGDFFKNPQVSVLIDRSSLRNEAVRVTIVGRVSKPGSHVLRVMSMLEGARIAAEGFLRDACSTQILVIRGKEIIVCDYLRFYLEGYGSAENIWLLNEDIIIVPKLVPEGGLLVEWQYVDEYFSGKISLDEMVARIGR
jgi:protein involved in polysaccharide export with SLBB domain